MVRRVLLTQLVAAMSPARRRQLLLVLALTLVSAVAEALTIGLLLPFLALLSDPSGSTLPEPVHRTLASTGDPVVAAALLLGAAALLLAGLRLALVWKVQRFAMDYGRELSDLVFGRMLRQPYLAYLTRNSSELLAGMEKTERIVPMLLQPVIQALVAAVLAIFVMGALLLVDAVAAGIAAAAAIAAYGAVSVLTRGRMVANSRIVAASVAARNRTVREALGGVRDVLLDGSQALHQEKYSAFNTRSRRAQAENMFLAQAPRYVVEAIGIVTMAVLALVASRGGGGLAEAVPVLGALALGAQRLLPLVQQMWSGHSQLSSHQQWLNDVAALMRIAVDDEAGFRPAPLAFNQDIVFDRVSFAYRSDRPVIESIDLSIQAGECVGLAGTTGSGKSTLADLLMGLIEPSAGEIRIDGQPLTRASRRSWQANIAHVPQSIYLTDDTIAANITLGQSAEGNDQERLAAAVRGAQLESFVASLPDGLETGVGERGVQLSGGQRQRIGIARALYRRAGILVLDEATDALDPATEAAVLAGIRQTGATIVMIAHRPSVLAMCDRVISLDAPPALPPVMELEATAPDQPDRHE